jgi:hypothetical protein
MNSAFEVLGRNVEAIRQLRPSVVAEFNRVNLNRKGVKFSVLAGNPLPVMCKTVVLNDGVVPVESAHWEIKDKALSRNLHTDLTGTADFSSFVKPRLAIGPKGNHNPEQPQLPRYPNQIGRGSDAPAAVEFVNASYGSQSSSVAGAVDDLRPAFAREVKLAPQQALEIELAVPAGANFGVTFMSGSKVSATLLDDKGAVQGKNLADSPESRGLFRTIFVERGMTAGTWKLKIENTGTQEAVAVIAAWSDPLKMQR